MANRSKGIAVVRTDSRRRQDGCTAELEVSEALARFVSGDYVAYAFGRRRLGNRRQETAIAGRGGAARCQGVAVPAICDMQGTRPWCARGVCADLAAWLPGSGLASSLVRLLGR
jgi:hypothetical protein